MKEKYNAKEMKEILDKLVESDDPEVRRAVAEQGYGLYILVDDEDADVRAAVADQGYGLFKLVNDEDPEVRSQYNADGNFTNFFYTYDCSYFNDFDENAIVYVWGLS